MAEHNEPRSIDALDNPIKWTEPYAVCPISLDQDIEQRALKSQARRYEASVIKFKEHEAQGSLYGGGEFYPHNTSDAYDGHGNPIVLRKYDATEDLAFLYCELGKIYNRLMELA